MSSYETMKQQVQITPGLDITLEDVDLLPWNSAEYNRYASCGKRPIILVVPVQRSSKVTFIRSLDEQYD